MAKIKAMSANIYKHKGQDFSNHGISEKYDEILYESPDGYVELDTEDLPENFCVLVKRELWGEKHYYFAPKTLIDAGKWVMSGGTIVSSSDSRYGEALGETTGRPIPLHDRVEQQIRF